MAPTKEEIRDTILKVRSEMSAVDVQRYSRRILDRLCTLSEFQRATAVHTYVSSKKNEVDTLEIIRIALSQAKRVVVPITDRSSETLNHSEILSLDDLSTGSFGIGEPIRSRPFSLTKLNLVIVPVVAIDRSGTRIGFGRGYYDKFLRLVACPMIALAYDCQFVDTISREAHDVPVDIIVTQSETVYCRHSVQR